MCGAARSSPSRPYDQAWYGQRSRLRTWPSRLLDDPRAAMAADVEEGARGPVLAAADHDDAVGAELAHQVTSRARRRRRRGRRQTQPRKIWLELPVEDARGRRRLAGGSIVARSTRPQGARRSRAGRGSSWIVEFGLGSLERPGPVREPLPVDLVVNRMLVSRGDGGQVARLRPGARGRRSSSTSGPGPPAAGAPIRRGRADPARGGGRARSAAAAAGDRSPRSSGRRSTPGLNGGHARPRARRPGLDPGRVGAGRGAVRPDHERDPLARAAGLQRLGPRLRRAHRPLPAPGASRRAQGRLRGHRARRRLRSSRSRRPPSGPTPASGSTARSGSSPAATTPPSTS